MNLKDDKQQNIQLDFSVAPTGEAREVGREETESSGARNESAVLAQTSRTAVYGPVRTVVWQGSAGDRRPYADLASAGKREQIPKGHDRATRWDKRKSE